MSLKKNEDEKPNNSIILNTPLSRPEKNRVDARTQVCHFDEQRGDCVMGEEKSSALCIRLCKR